MKKNTDKICVLMATYNGELYIQEQIKSILSQTHENLILMIRDDASKDNTLSIVNDYKRLDSRIVLVRDNYGNLGSNQNFDRLLNCALTTEVKYFCFADQDDVWDKSKLEVMLKEILLLEKVNGPNLPILVYSDLEVVDANLKLINASFMRLQGLDHPKAPTYRRLLVQNTVTGCATLFNRPLLKIASNMPRGVIVHDWWLALCASACGVIGYLPIGLVKYRQHGNNQIGATGHLSKNNPLKKEFYIKLWGSRKRAIRLMEQASCLLAIKDNFIYDDLEKKIILFCSLGRVSFINRIIYLKEIKVSRASLVGSLYLMVRLFFI